MRLLHETVHQLLVCEQVCLSAAEACLSTPLPEARADCVECVLRCAQACSETVLRFLRHPAVTPSLQLQACAEACAACVVHCARHARGCRRCRVCAAICRRCQRRCLLLALSVPLAAGNN